MNTTDFWPNIKIKESLTGNGTYCLWYGNELLSTHHSSIRSAQCRAEEIYEILCSKDPGPANKLEKNRD